MTASSLLTGAPVQILSPAGFVLLVFAATGSGSNVKSPDAKLAGAVSLRNECNSAERAIKSMKAEFLTENEYRGLRPAVKGDLDKKVGGAHLLQWRKLAEEEKRIRDAQAAANDELVAQAEEAQRQ